jgi:hypothetical protein
MNFKTWVAGELVDAATFNSELKSKFEAIWKGVTAGDTDYYSSDSAKTRLPIGTAGQILKVNASGNAPEWGGLIGASVSKSQTFNADSASVTFDTEKWDSSGFVNLGSNNQRITIPAGLGGAYMINVSFAGTPSASNSAVTKLYVTLTRCDSAGVEKENQTVEVVVPPNSIWEATSSFMRVQNVTAGDYFYATLHRNLITVNSWTDTIVTLLKVG